jgi:hypothetical protein
MVLDAYTPGRREFSLDPAGLQKSRESAGGCFPSLQEYEQAFAQAPKPQTTTPGNKVGGGGGGGDSGGSQFVTNSSYFRLTSFVTIGSTEFNLYSLLYQDTTGSVRPLLRSYTPD